MNEGNSVDRDPVDAVVRRRVRVTYESDVLGDGVFFDDYVDERTTLRNVVAELIAKQTAEDGLPRKVGMWRSVEIVE